MKSYHIRIVEGLNHSRERLMMDVYRDSIIEVVKEFSELLKKGETLWIREEKPKPLKN